MNLPARRTLCTLALLLVANGAWAQQLYRSVDANGRVIFSDQPPAASAKAPPARNAPSPGSAVASTSNPGLPYELRQVVQRYPVTLYTGDQCGPCETGRSLLTTRGIPFDERTVKTAEDTDALQRLSGQASLPMLAIGSQQLKGFSDAEWSQYLDAAGYPKSNQLPSGFRVNPPAPLVAQQAAPAVRADTQRAAPTPTSVPAPAPEGPTPSNPAGIRF